MIDHRHGCAKQVGGKCNCETPEPPMTQATISPETYMEPPAPPKGFDGPIRHIVSANQPSDFEYRTKAMEFALSVLARHAKVYTSADTIQVASKIEEYLRNGKTK